MIRYFFSLQFLAFVAVGGFAATLNWVSRMILDRWMSFSFAIICAYLVGMTVAFTLNRVYVFPKSRKSLHEQARNFVLVNLAFLPVVLATTLVLEPLFGSIMSESYARTAAHGVGVAVPAVLTFLIYKFHAFKDSEYAGR